MLLEIIILDMTYYTVIPYIDMAYCCYTSVIFLFSTKNNKKQETSIIDNIYCNCVRLPAPDMSLSKIFGPVPLPFYPSIFIFFSEYPKFYQVAL